MLVPSDREICAAFETGDAPWEVEVGRFLKEKVWQAGRPRGEETHVAFTIETGELIGYATWKHRDLVVGDTNYGKVIDIASFGIDESFKSEVDHDGTLLAVRLYAYTEEVARTHSDSTDDMAIHLVCDNRNERALRFWERNGFVPIGLVPIPALGITYIRMIRA